MRGHVLTRGSTKIAAAVAAMLAVAPFPSEAARSLEPRSTVYAAPFGVGTGWASRSCSPTYIVPETTTCRVAASADYETGRFGASVEVATPQDGLAPGVSRSAHADAGIAFWHELATTTDHVTVTATFRVHDGARTCDAKTPLTICRIESGNITLFASIGARASKTEPLDAVRGENTWTISLDVPASRGPLRVGFGTFSRVYLNGTTARVGSQLPRICVPFTFGLVCTGYVDATTTPIGKAVTRGDFTLVRIEIVET